MIQALAYIDISDDDYCRGFASHFGNLSEICGSGGNGKCQALEVMDFPYRMSQKMIALAKECEDSYTVIVNSPLFVSQDYAKLDNIYLFDWSELKFKNVQSFTDKELRFGHNLTKLLIGGCFGENVFRKVNPEEVDSFFSTKQW